MAVESPAKTSRSQHLHRCRGRGVADDWRDLLLLFRAIENNGSHRLRSKSPVPSDAVLRARLKPDQYHVTRENGTETAFHNEYWENHRAGIYVDVITGEPLFTSLDKFDGARPAHFHKPISKDRHCRKSWILRTTCSAPKFARNEAMRTSATCSPIRHRRPANATPSTPPPSVSSPSKAWRTRATGESLSLLRQQ